MPPQSLSTDNPHTAHQAAGMKQKTKIQVPQISTQKDLANPAIMACAARISLLCRLDFGRDDCDVIGSAAAAATDPGDSEAQPLIAKLL